jgi:hypothetical protein
MSISSRELVRAIAEVAICHVENRKRIMIAQPTAEEMTKINWDALDAVRIHAEAAVRAKTMNEATWKALLGTALVATGGVRAPALSMMALYAEPEWLK